MKYLIRKIGFLGNLFLKRIRVVYIVIGLKWEIIFGVWEACKVRYKIEGKIEGKIEVCKLCLFVWKLEFWGSKVNDGIVEGGND